MFTYKKATVKEKKPETKTRLEKREVDIGEYDVNLVLKKGGSFHSFIGGLDKQDTINKLEKFKDDMNGEDRYILVPTRDSNVLYILRKDDIDLIQLVYRPKIVIMEMEVLDEVKF